MATRAGGTGTLVTLVIFVIATVALLVFSVIMWSNQSAAEQRASDARAALQKIVLDSQLQRDDVKRLQADADRNKKTLVAFMVDQGQAAAAFVSGDRGRSLDDLAQPFGIDPKNKDSTTLKAEWDRVRSDLNTAKADLEAKDAANKKLLEQMDDLRKKTDEAIAAKNDEIKRVQDSIRGYQEATEKYGSDVNAAVADIQKSKDQIEQTYRSRMGELQSQIDALNAERDLLRTRNVEMSRKLGLFELKAPNPATLVDGRVIDVNAADGTVFLNLGRADRVQPGMTFEVYETPESIQVDDRTGAPVRGKGSIQVVRVSDNTSTARITRGTAARPVVKDDLIVNAVYQPGMKYRFLVFGKFDVDQDGRPTEDEADYIRSRVREWGGEVNDGNSLTGDLDFLILGQQPPPVPPLPTDATSAQYSAYMEARTARESYDKLFSDAIEAQIPVLNWNRFQILTGQGTR
ncbi:MAG: hypothetical protein FJ253_04605 [Phycisphaerae bacterium]|nr:hypothetical protein [Phycisphaerae bacterium]